MNLLHGLSAPEGDGTVLEVHLDIRNPTTEFLAWVAGRGFENDPFDLFYPAGYTDHMTGRTRVPKERLSRVKPEIDALVEEIVVEAQFRDIQLYAEVELVRHKTYFPEEGERFGEGVLGSVILVSTNQKGKAKADIHVEFERGTVSREVREYLLQNCFYWVSTPETDHFPAEEIATLQTETFGGAKKVYELLVAEPLRGCTGIHLEQKLSMRATAEGIPLPEVIAVHW